MNIIQARILDQNKPQEDNRPRERLRCVEWNVKTQIGVIVDSNGFRFNVVAADLAPECDGQLDVSQFVSGILDEPVIVDILIESGPRAIGNIPAERKEFESVGPSPEVRGWAPGGTPDTGLRGGKPDSGRFSHQGPEHGK